MNVIPTESNRSVMRQISGLGMEDPLHLKSQEEAARPSHPSIIYDDMSFTSVAKDMRGLVRVDSDHTARAGDGLDMALYQESLLRMSCSESLTTKFTDAPIDEDRNVAEEDTQDYECTSSNIMKDDWDYLYQSICSLTVEDLSAPDPTEEPRKEDRVRRMSRKRSTRDQTCVGSASTQVDMRNQQHTTVPCVSPERTTARHFDLNLPSLSNCQLVRLDSNIEELDSGLESFHESLYSLMASQTQMSLVDSADTLGSSSDALILRTLSQSLTELHCSKESFLPKQRTGSSLVSRDSSMSTGAAAVASSYRYLYPTPGTKVQPSSPERRELPSLVRIFPP